MVSPINNPESGDEKETRREAQEGQAGQNNCVLTCSSASMESQSRLRSAMASITVGFCISSMPAAAGLPSASATGGGGGREETVGRGMALENVAPLHHA